MSSTDLQSDAFLQLLADALRAGPGSPQWRQAVTTLRENSDSPHADDYQLLITARERLESGKPYREVRPGPGFTRKVMEQVDQYRPGSSRWASWSTWIALLAVAVLITVVILVGRHSGTEAESDSSLQALGAIYFVTPALTADLSEPLTPEWEPIGSLEVTHSRWGLRPRSGEGESADYRGGGIVATTRIPAGQAFAVETHIRGRNLGDDLIPQLFITDTPEFSATLGTTPHELAWLIKSRRPTVALPDGRLEGTTADNPSDLRQSMTVRIVMNDRFAIVECGGERLWAGEHQLDPAKPRQVGLRFLRRGSDGQDHLAFESAKLLYPQVTP